MAHELEPTQDAEQHEYSEHVVPVGVYLAVFAALLVLTGVTVWTAHIDLGAVNTPLALAIAVTKATLVILFFMHVKYSGKLVRLAVAAGIFWLFHLIVGTAADYASRSRVNPAGRPGETMVLEDR
ncbi:MAG TPA: cytochrome C oxidase subunit IV family protein [Vicinamibacteria bacterium]|jgi:cytochrome c oxidase subunit 4